MPYPCPDTQRLACPLTDKSGAHRLHPEIRLLPGTAILRTVISPSPQYTYSKHPHNKVESSGSILVYHSSGKRWPPYLSLSHWCQAHVLMLGAPLYVSALSLQFYSVAPLARCRLSVSYSNVSGLSLKHISKALDVPTSRSRSKDKAQDIAGDKIPNKGIGKGVWRC